MSKINLGLPALPYFLRENLSGFECQHGPQLTWVVQDLSWTPLVFWMSKTPRVGSQKSF
jgi:hypothetical protein